MQIQKRWNFQISGRKWNKIFSRKESLEKRKKSFIQWKGIPSVRGKERNGKSTVKKKKGKRWGLLRKVSDGHKRQSNAVQVGQERSRMETGTAKKTRVQLMRCGTPKRRQPLLFVYIWVQSLPSAVHEKLLIFFFFLSLFCCLRTLFRFAFVSVFINFPSFVFLLLAWFFFFFGGGTMLKQNLDSITKEVNWCGCCSECSKLFVLVAAVFGFAIFWCLFLWKTLTDRKRTLSFLVP